MLLLYHLVIWSDLSLNFKNNKHNLTINSFKAEIMIVMSLFLRLYVILLIPKLVIIRFLIKCIGLH